MGLQKEIEQFLRDNSVSFAKEEKSISIPDKGVRLHLVELKEHKNEEDPAKKSNISKSSTLNRPKQHLLELKGGKFVESHSTENVNFKNIYIYEDRWRRNKDLVQKRILCNLGIFHSIYARNCRVLSSLALGRENRINSDRIKRFLENYHSYGYVKSPFHYALEHKGEVVAVATFSKPRVYNNVLSYEWTRYASLPDIRVVGGMGKLIDAFIKEIKEKKCLSSTKHKIEIMSYSDNESGEGDSYLKLGFKEVGTIPPISYYVDLKSYARYSEHQMETLKKGRKGSLHPDTEENAPRQPAYQKITNRGSRKFVLTVED